MSTDLELWSRVAKGDSEASVVFLEAWRRRGEVRISHESALPWLLGVANNVLRNRHRSLRRGPVMEGPEGGIGG
ncbi:hypothetical protein [Nonomuraea sp. NPDC003709]|uniref:hypothetical protein n=1 Tax=Nonomuraea sp. NPDC003709 TaxID=3154450 RepID=UPI0033A8F5D9